MLVYPVNLTVEESEKLSEFHETMKGYRDYSRFFKHMIMKVIYNDSWTTYEEENGLAIFETYDNSLYFINYGHCVMLPDVVEFNPIQITKEVAEQMISEMIKEISENQTNFITHK